MMLKPAKNVIGLGVDSTGLARSVLTDIHGNLITRGGISTPVYNVVFNGDSLSLGLAAVIEPLLPAGSVCTEIAVGGAVITSYFIDNDPLNMYYTQLWQSDLYWDDDKINIAVVWAGTNDLAFIHDTTLTYPELTAYCTSLQYRGWRVVVVTTLPRGDGFSIVNETEWQTEADEYNNLIINNYTDFADALVDTTTCPELGQDGDEDDLTYYSDKIHLTATGLTIIAPYFVTALNTIITAAPEVSSLRRGLIYTWTLDEAGGVVTRQDTSLMFGGSNNLQYDLLTATNVASVAGVINNAAHFDPALFNQFTNGHITLISPGDSDFTWSCWIYMLSDPGAMFIVSKVDDIFVDGWSIEYDLAWSTVDQKLRFFVGNGVDSSGYALSSSVLTQNTWYFVVGWHDSVANTVNIQVNNGPVSSSSYSGGSHSGNQGLRVGCIDTGAQGLYFHGYLDSLKFYRRVLTADERALLYTGIEYPFS